MGETVQIELSDYYVKQGAEYVFKLFLSFLVACSSAPGDRLNLPSGIDFIVRSQAHQSITKSLNSIEDRRRYLLALFEQSYDLYYKTPRWSKKCLEENRIGVIEQTEKGIFFISQLVLSPRLEPGFCSGNDNFQRYYVAMIQCKDGELFELKVETVKIDPSFNWTSLCD